MAKLKIGDIVEIPTEKGISYAQYTHTHKMYGALLRVLPGFFTERPDSWSKLVSSVEKFVIFFPLKAAVNQKIFSIVANHSVPDASKAFPTFRAGVVNPETNKVGVWWLWDGEKEWRIDNLSKAQRKLPIRGVWNDTLLIERIVSGWLPETDPT